jgi:nucleotide-binding universal stress UspA family protein
MQRIKNILVGTDGSVHAAIALDWVGRLATALGASVRIVHCVPTSGHDGDGVDQLVVERALALWSNELNAPGIDPDCTVLHGDPRIGIQHLAEETDADLIVVGARGEGGFDDLRLGSVASDLIHHADRPVAIVPHVGGPIAGGAVVAGIDGSRANRPAIAFAADLAEQMDGNVEAVFVHDAMADSYGHGPATNWKYRGQAHAEELLTEFETAHPSRLHFHNRGGNTITELRGFADERSAAMIVIGTRGHWGLGGRAVGHIAAQLAGHSRVAVVVVPHES